ncbi:MAG TPA: hypothetical protein VGG03_19495 [Thermoanaerobaculia bacterium]|jgi:aspartate/methionine/tyrosine aminotransferase
MDPILDADAVIQGECPALWEALSPLGRRARQPANFLPLQTLEARGKAFNATIGQITDGQGRAVPLSPMLAALVGLDEEERSRSFLYSPVDGLPELRRAWRAWQRRGQRPDLPSSLPTVTVGPAHARCLAAELFVAEGRSVVLPQPCRDGDRDLFVLRLGARPLPCAEPLSVSRILDGLPEGEPAVVLLESSPAFLDGLLAAAERRPLVVIVDDTWERLGTPSASLFWGLAGRHPNLIPIKVDGADGHFGFPGGRVGFLTFPFEPESPIAAALESKVKMLLRAQVGSPSAATQVVLLRALRERGPTAATPPTAPARPSQRRDT